MSGNTIANINEFGASGDGKTDCTSSFKKALDSGVEKILIPRGQYVITSPLLMDSNTFLCCDKNARLIAKTGAEFPIISNKAPGCTNISVCGGIFDGEKNPLSFCGVSNLSISDISVINSSDTFICCTQAENFEIQNISLSTFSSNSGICGIRIDSCRNGKISNVKTLTDGTVDSVVTVSSHNGVTEDIRVNGIYSMECGRLAEITSQNAEIRGIEISDIAGGCLCHAVSIGGKRQISNISISDAELFSAGENSRSLICVSDAAHNICVTKLRRPGLLDNLFPTPCPTLDVSLQHTAEISLSGIDKNQIYASNYASHISTYAIKPFTFEVLIKKHDRLVLPHGGFEKMTITTAEI